jgi:putative SOS response-associated peptidase YedK
MCGRYVLYSSPHAVALQFGLAHEPDFAPSYNIAPGRIVVAIRAEPNHARRAVALAWGLTPSWAKSRETVHHFYNARADHLAQKPSFRNALLFRRCIVPADGFYEWHTSACGREPYYVRPRHAGLFGFAGIYETHPGPPGAAGTCAIITVAANGLLAPLNPRMPAILGVEDYARWLDPDHPDPLSLVDVLRPAPVRFMRADRVSVRVNDVANDDPSLLAPTPTSAPRADGELF